MNCALTHYLEEASSTGMGDKATFAGAVLADLGYFERNQQRADVDDLPRLIEILAKNGNRDTLAEMARYCKSCSLSAGCPVSEIILKR